MVKGFVKFMNKSYSYRIKKANPFRTIYYANSPRGSQGSSRTISPSANKQTNRISYAVWPWKNIPFVQYSNHIPQDVVSEKSKAKSHSPSFSSTHLTLFSMGLLSVGMRSHFDRR